MLDPKIIALGEELLGRLEGCKAFFDPCAEHLYGTEQPQRVVFVPLDLHEAVKAYLLGLQCHLYALDGE